MTRSIRLGILWLGLVSLVAASSVACAALPDTVKGSFERTLKVTGPADIDVNTGSGNITVRPGDGSTVRIVGTIHAWARWLDGEGAARERVRRLEANPPIEQHGNVIRIGRSEERELQRNVGISYEITLPAESRVRANTGSGDIDLSGIRGSAGANTGSGNITIAQSSGEVRATTGSGNIRLDLAGGDVRASTGSGNIHAFGLTGALRASTGSGNITAEGKLGNAWDLETGSGNVTARLAADAGFEVDAHTGSGGIRTNHPITILGTFGKDTLRGTVRGGGPRLLIRTGSGGIRIE